MINAEKNEDTLHVSQGRSMSSGCLRNGLDVLTEATIPKPFGMAL